MVLRRSAASRYGSRIGSFFMVVLAGTLYRIERSGAKLFDRNHLQALTEKDSPFLPEQIKVLYRKQQANVFKYYNLPTVEQRQQLAIEDPYTKLLIEEQQKLAMESQAKLQARVHETQYRQQLFLQLMGKTVQK